MAANSVELSETNGTTGSPTTTDGITNINFSSLDVPSLDNPATGAIIIGANSYLKWLRFKLVTNNNTSNSVIRVALTSSSPYVTGEVIGGHINSGCVSESYWPSGYGNIGGIQNVTPPYNGNLSCWYSGVDVTVANVPVPTSTPATANVAIGGSLAGTLTVNGTYSTYFAMQLTTTSSTPSGLDNAKTFTITYNEV